MRLRAGWSGLVALLLVGSTACASSGVEEPGADAPRTSAVSTVADDAAGTDAAPVPETATTTAKTALSGCNAAGTYEICFSSPAAKGGSDPAVVRHFIDI